MCVAAELPEKNNNKQTKQQHQNNNNTKFCHDRMEYFMCVPAESYKLSKGFAQQPEWPTYDVCTFSMKIWFLYMNITWAQKTINKKKSGQHFKDFFSSNPLKRNNSNIFKSDYLVTWSIYGLFCKILNSYHSSLFYLLSNYPSELEIKLPKRN